ncbi:MAG: glycosyltransferase family 8 protein [Ruminococcaceae bacterium]|jgi:lipopolysaccharide biosynthesis glycosyltransferase|nr:glycosyltransferase family 8 protein [Oscillospiraceae bacterium]
MNKTLTHTLDEFDIEESGGKQWAEEIKPAFPVNNVAICLVSSDEYAPFAAVVISSLIINATPDNNYDIVLMTNDMLMQNRWRIERLADDHNNVSVRVVDISKIIENFSFYTWAHFTSYTYYRLLTPDLFAAYEKVIYLDSDIVVNHDIAELYHTDIRGAYLAAAYDTHVVAYCTRTPPLEQRQYNKDTLGLKDPEQYYQAGVSLFNVMEIRRDFGEGYLIKQGLKHKLRWLDQDLLNMLFQGKIKRIPNRWNVMVSNVPDLLDEYDLPEQLRHEYFEARRNPYIVHYVGKSMPCYVTTYRQDMYEFFWKYARQTPFYEVLLLRMSVDYSEKLAESIRIQLRQEIGQGKTTESFRQRLKRHAMSICNFFFPRGSRRRVYLKRFLFRFRQWN